MLLKMSTTETEKMVHCDFNFLSEDQCGHPDNLSISVTDPGCHVGSHLNMFQFHNWCIPIPVKHHKLTEEARKQKQNIKLSN